MEKWTPAEIKQYSDSIKAARRQRSEQARRKNKWMDDFLAGKEVPQYDKITKHIEGK